MSIDVGDVVTLTWAYGLSTTAAVTVTLPDGSTSSPSVTGSSTYTASYTTTQEGYHRVRWVGTVTNVGAYEDSFNVESSALSPIISLADAKTHLGISVSTNDEQLRQILDVSSQICEDRTKLVWRRRTVTAEVHSGAGTPYLRLFKAPIVSVTSVTENGAAVTDYVIDAPTGTLQRGTTLAAWYWWPGQGNISVTYVAGPPGGVVPANIQHGVRQLVRHLWNYQRGGSNVPRQAGADSEVDPRSGYTVPYAVLEAWGTPTTLLVG